MPSMQKSVGNYKDRLRTLKSLRVVQWIALIFGSLTVACLVYAQKANSDIIRDSLNSDVAALSIVALGGLYIGLMILISHQRTRCKQVSQKDMRDIMNAVRRNPELNKMLALIQAQDRRPLADEMAYIINYDFEKSCLDCPPPEDTLRRLASVN